MLTTPRDRDDPVADPDPGVPIDPGQERAPLLVSMETTLGSVEAALGSVEARLRYLEATLGFVDFALSSLRARPAEGAATTG